MSACIILSVLYIIGWGTGEITSQTRWPTKFSRKYIEHQNHRLQTNRSYSDPKPQPDFHTERDNNHYNTIPVIRYDYRNIYDHKREGNGQAPYTTGIYRSYGRGIAVVPSLGATVSVANAIPYPKIHKGTVTARVLDGKEIFIRKPDKNCIGCPENRAVVASRGHAHVLLPQPCPTLRWSSLSGPRPGSLIPEGTHTLIGRLGSRGKICRYDYEVVVRHCGTFTVQSGNANCTVDDVWGSVCNVTCDEGFELIGPSVLECGNDLKWSSQPPLCRKKKGCPPPQTPDNARVWCQVLDENDLDGDILPADTYCRFRSNGRQRIITCIDGYWVKKRGRGKKHRSVKPSKRKKFAENGRVFPKIRPLRTHSTERRRVGEGNSSDFGR